MERGEERARGKTYLLAVPGVLGDGVEGDWEGFLPSSFRVLVIRYFTPEWKLVSKVCGGNITRKIRNTHTNSLSFLEVSFSTSHTTPSLPPFP